MSPQSLHRTRHRFSVRAALSRLGLLLTSGSSFRGFIGALSITALCSSAVAGPYAQDLTPLFEAPTAQEIAQVRADWATRPIVDEGFQLEASGFDSNGAQVDIVSHIVDGARHFAAIRYPQNFDPSLVYRTVLLCHGGVFGVDLQGITNLLGLLSGGCLEGDSFLVIPSFRSETLQTGFAGSFTSGGTPSPANRDVDDTLSLLTVALRNYPQMDDARVVAWGVSRGAAVAMIAAVRDDRIRRVVNNFGFTDFSLPSVRARVDAIQNQGAQATGIGAIVWESSIEPWLNGTLTLSEARSEWIKRSVCYFADELPELQVHHGLADTLVDASHTTVLLDALSSEGASFPEVQGFFYPGGQHNVNSFIGYAPRAVDFLCQGNFIEPRGFCGPTNPTAQGLFASADYRGSSSLAASDFVFRAVDLLPNGAGLVFVGPSTGYQPAGAGFLCLGAGFQRAGVALTNAAGVFELPIDFATANPLLDPIFSVGTEAHFQVVFRDTQNSAGTFNFSNGLSVMIRP